MKSLSNILLNRINTCLILLALFGVMMQCSSVFAQGKSKDKKVMNLQNYDNRVIHFGFLLGVNLADFRIKYNPNYFGVDTV